MLECLSGLALLGDPRVEEGVGYHPLEAEEAGYRHLEAAGVDCYRLEVEGVVRPRPKAEEVGHRYLEAEGVVHHRRYQVEEEVVIQSVGS